MVRILPGTEGTEGTGTERTEETATEDTEGTATGDTEGTEFTGGTEKRRRAERDVSRVAESATPAVSVVAASALNSGASFKCPAISGGVIVAIARRMTVDPSEFNDITRRILAGAIEVH